MADIVLKDRNGNDMPPFEGVGSIKVYTEDGGVECFTHGESVEKTVALNFAEGDMEITPEEGQVFSKVYIPKPVSLAPPNIAKDIDIAGIVGEHSGGGGGDEIAGSIISRTATDIYLPEADAAPNAFYNYPTANSITVRNAGQDSFYFARFETITLTGDTIAFEAFKNCTAKKINAPNVTSVSSVSYAFYQCTYLEEIDMPNAVFYNASHTFYGCTKLKSYKNTAVCDRNDISNNMFVGCSKIETIDFLSPVYFEYASVLDSCPALKKVILRGGVYRSSPVNLNGSSNAIVFVPLALMDATIAKHTGWAALADAGRLQALEGGVAAFDGEYVLYNQSAPCSVDYFRPIDSENTEGLAITARVVSGNTDIATVSDVVVNEDTIDFNLNTLAVEGDVDITVYLTIGENTFERSATYSVVETIPPTYSVASAGAAYTFTLNSSTGYYVSGNKGISKSCALCKVTFNTQGGHLYLDCISYGESKYDYGILSTIDKTLTTSYSADSTNVFKSFQNLSSASVQTVDYGEIAAGEHFIYVKYIKDSSGNNNNDTLQFKVRFE